VCTATTVAAVGARGLWMFSHRVACMFATGWRVCVWATRVAPPVQHKKEEEKKLGMCVRLGHDWIGCLSGVLALCSGRWLWVAGQVCVCVYV
jgi:hypothetical protein